MTSKRLGALLVATAILAAHVVACGQPQPPTVVPADPGFQDFTTPHLSSLEQLRRFAATPPGDEVGAAIVGTKFVITRFSNPRERSLSYLDGRYYLYHDEWAWFRLLNGQEVATMPRLEPHAVNTPEEGRRWAQAAPDELPDGLGVVDGRLYSEEFYRRALTERREFGAGSLIYVPPRHELSPGSGQVARPAMWAFELEYLDRADVDDVLVFFDLLQRSVPSDVANQLKWLTRSPWQAEVGQRLVVEHPRYAGRVVDYSELSVPGETAVYTPGIVAGRLQVFRDLSQLDTADPENILLLGALPEYLPQARGILTAVPQTPLAHLNLLARSRGIINGYRGALLDDPQVLNLVRSGVPVVLSAEGGQLEFRELTELQYANWRNLERSSPPAPRVRSIENAPYLVDLASLDASQLDDVAPLIGGKAVGMVHLLSSLGPRAVASNLPSTGVDLDVPERPLAITVRAYREHLAPLVPKIQTLLADPNFRQSRKLRILALEGLKKFEKRFPGKRDRSAARTYSSPKAAGPIAEVVRAGGLQYLIRHTKLPPAVEQQLETVRRHFASYAPNQGLRFRSSSTVEDVEGSSGAGLYDSATGFVDAPPGDAPSAARSSKDRPSLADALRKTWASYYSVEAFEERHESGMDHLAGDMAVLLHARFEDTLEDANGVFTFTHSSSGAELLIDAQPGAISVTNPPTDRIVRPESARVTLRGTETPRQGDQTPLMDESPTIETLSASSETREAQPVLSRSELEALFEWAHQVTRRQIELINARLPSPQQRSSLVMDFEFRRVKAGWPALRNGRNPARFVIKQMRPLERNPVGIAALRDAPIPRDILARARRVEQRTCAERHSSAPKIGEPVVSAVVQNIKLLLVYTDANAAPDLGFSEEPLVASITLARGDAVTTFTHVDTKQTSTSSEGFSVTWRDGLAPSEAHLVGETLTVRAPHLGLSTETPLSCSTELIFAAPSELLRSYLE